MNKLMTTLIASVFLVAAGSAMAGDRGPGGKHQRGGPQGSQIMDQFKRELRQLDLSDEQKASVKVIMQDLREQIMPIGKDLRDNHLAFRDLIKSENWDENAAALLADNEGDLTAQRTLLTNKALADIYAQLNDEQRAELAAKAQQRAERHAERAEKRAERMAENAE